MLHILTAPAPPPTPPPPPGLVPPRSWAARLPGRPGQARARPDPGTGRSAYGGRGPAASTGKRSVSMTAAISRGLTASAPQRRFGRQSDCRGLTPPPPRRNTNCHPHPHPHPQSRHVCMCVCVVTTRLCVLFEKRQCDVSKKSTPGPGLRGGCSGGQNPLKPVSYVRCSTVSGHRSEFIRSQTDGQAPSCTSAAPSMIKSGLKLTSISHGCPGVGEGGSTQCPIMSQGLFASLPR